MRPNAKPLPHTALETTNNGYPEEGSVPAVTAIRVPASIVRLAQRKHHLRPNRSATQAPIGADNSPAR